MNSNSYVRMSSRHSHCAYIAIPLVMSLCSIVSAHAQVAIKTNLVYDATTTPNVGMEIGVAQRQTLQLFYGLNTWQFPDEKRVKHWLLMPEYRWWTCTKFNGSFFGVHAMGGQFNAANVSLPVPGAFFGGDNLRTELRDNNYEGRFAGIGITYGFQWILGDHFNLEAELGVGYAHVWYDKYRCGTCGPKLSEGQTNYAGLTKLGLSVLYLF